MADDEKPVAPSAAAKPKPARIEVPTVIVKGGTTSSAYDKMLQKERFDTEHRRAVQDRQYQIAEQSPANARLMSMNLGGSQSSAMVVLALKHKKDNLMLDWIICEVIQHGPEELVLNMACPQCHAKNPGHEPDFKIHQSNRKWWLDPNPPKWMREIGHDRIWMNPKDQSTVVVAGSVTTEDWIRCPGLGCTWHFKIDDSVVHSK